MHAKKTLPAHFTELRSHVQLDEVIGRPEGALGNEMPGRRSRPHAINGFHRIGEVDEPVDTKFSGSADNRLRSAVRT